MISLDQILRGGCELGATDIHLVRGIAPAFRVNGEIRLAKCEPLDESALRDLVDTMLEERHKRILVRESVQLFNPGFKTGNMSAQLRYLF